MIGVMMRKIIEGIAMITQLGITIMTPIFLCIYIGIKMDQWLFTSYWFLIFLFLGFITALRNAYFLTKRFYFDDKSKEEKCKEDNNMNDKI
jgi:ATP synthase protein I